jgi:phosphoribosylglycinamide formyltransferase 1
VQRNEKNLFIKQISEKNVLFLLFTIYNFLILKDIFYLSMIKIAIFASGSGSNAQRIVEYFKGHKQIQIELILTNKKDAYVIERAKLLNLPCLIFNRHDFYESDYIFHELESRKIDFIVLAGFLWLVPSSIIHQYHKRIVNIHPALLPAYGGKGMYGDRVHKSVIANKEKISGITIHYVNEQYDEGDVIFQASCNVLDTDTSDSLAEKIHALEYAHFPEVIENLLCPKVEKPD